MNTIRVDSKVVHETDTDEAKSDEIALDAPHARHRRQDATGRATARAGRSIPEGFEELAKKLERPLHPPGRDVRCIVSVGMLTEGWDCNTVTHIVGLRPFMSQLLCEQVVGRGLRRAQLRGRRRTASSTEEVAKVFGVPFEVIPFKANPQGQPTPPPKRHHVHAVPAKARFEIKFPRVEGYTQAIRNRVDRRLGQRRRRCGSTRRRSRPRSQMKARCRNNTGRPSLTGPGELDEVTLNPYRAGRRRAGAGLRPWPAT